MHIQRVVLAIVLAAACKASPTAPLAGRARPGRAVRAIPTKGAVQLAIDEGHTCARMADGTVRCWGDNGGGALGDGTDVERHTPVEVHGIAHAVDLANGLGWSCARLADRTVQCWGSLTFLDDGAHGEAAARGPVAVAALDRAETWWIGDDGDGCARWRDDTTKCWGGGAGFLAAGHPGKYGTFPVAAQPSLDGARQSIANAAQIAVFHAFACVRLADGTVACMGTNDRGQLGDGTTTDRAAFASVRGLPRGVRVLQISVGFNHACARLADGALWCWGDGIAVGGSPGQQPVPVAIAGVHDVVEVASGSQAVCAAQRDGVVTCWGHWGHLAGDTAWSQGPAEVPSLHGARQLALGTSHSCAVLAGDRVACWGDNRSGQLGDGTMDERREPTPVRW